MINDNRKKDFLRVFMIGSYRKIKDIKKPSEFLYVAGFGGEITVWEIYITLFWTSATKIVLKIKKPPLLKINLNLCLKCKLGANHLNLNDCGLVVP
jgi:hypothetical protein